MRLYQARYKIDCFPEALPGLLAEEAELVFQEGSLSEYRTKEGDHRIKKYYYDNDKKELTVSVRLTQKYGFYSVLPIVLIFVTLFTDIFVGLARDIILLWEGLAVIGLGITIMILPMSQPDFFHTDRRTARIFRLPYLRRTKLKVSRVAVFFLSLGFYAVSPWIFPTPDIIIELISLTIVLIIYVCSRITVKDRTTPMLLFLLMFSALPVWLLIANFVIFSQYVSFIQQEANFLREIQKILFPEYIVKIYAEIVSYKLLNILLINLFMLTLGIYYAPRLWENVKSQRLWTGGAEKISYNQKMHLALLCLYLAYFLSSIGIVISFSTGILIVQIKSGIELVAIFMPSIIVCIVFICIQGRKYLHLRREILNQTTRFELRGYHTDIEIFSVENLEATAFVVNLTFSDPKILIDRQLTEKQDHKEIAAIYFHEMYHIHSKTSNYQRVANVPVVGPMFFLAFINPEEVYAEEFRADEFAAEKVGREVVISAIEAANEETHTRSNSSSTASDFQKILNFLELITTVPVVGIYRPTRRQRIQNLKEIQP